MSLKSLDVIKDIQEMNTRFWVTYVFSKMFMTHPVKFFACISLDEVTVFTRTVFFNLF